MLRGERAERPAQPFPIGIGLSEQAPVHPVGRPEFTALGASPAPLVLADPSGPRPAILQRPRDGAARHRPGVQRQADPLSCQRRDLSGSIAHPDQPIPDQRPRRRGEWDDPPMDFKPSSAGQRLSEVGALRLKPSKQLYRLRPRGGQGHSDADPDPPAAAGERPRIAIRGEFPAKDKHGLLLVVGRGFELLFDAEAKLAVAGRDPEPPARGRRVSRGIHDDLGPDVLGSSRSVAKHCSGQAIPADRKRLERRSRSY